jgi:hypothetical protein
MSSWVPFHSALREGDKRGLPRAVRFVYLELSLLARPTQGRIALPRGFRSDVDAIHDILGGDRREIRLALDLLTVPLDPTDPLDEPMLSVSGPKERRIVDITAHSRWVRPDTTAERVRRFRSKPPERLPVVTDGCNAFSNVTETVTPVTDVTGQRRGEERREKEREETETAAVAAAPVSSPTHETPDATVVVPPSDAPKRVKRTRAGTAMTSWPEGFSVSPAIDRMCRAEGLPDPYDVIRDFESSARAKGYQYADWESAFRKWMRSDITRKSYPVWEAPEAPMPPKNYGPPADPTPEQTALLHRMISRPKAQTSLLAQVQAEDAKAGANVFWTPKPRAGGAT